MEPDDDQDKIKHYHFKVITVGDIGVGKTSLIRRYVENKFTMNYKSTIGVDYSEKSVNWNENIIVTLQIWDCAGQERFDSIIKSYFRDSHGAICVFDMSRNTTLGSVAKWKKKVSELCISSITREKIDPPCLLLANKADLVNRDIEFKNVSDTEEFCGIYQTSAKSSINIDTSMKCLIEEMIKREDENKNKEYVHDHMIKTVEKITQLDDVSTNKEPRRCHC